MPFLLREQVSPEIRKPYEGAYKGQLRQALTNPGLSVEQRERIKTQLAEVGKPKVYRADSPPKPGAISFRGPLPPRKVLESLKKADLLVIARGLGYPTDGTKAQLVDRLLAATSEEGGK